MPQDESICHMTKVSVNGSLHWFTWKRNIFSFEVKKESYCLFLLPPLVYKCNDSKDIGLTEYEGKLFIICIDRESGFMKV